MKRKLSLVFEGDLLLGITLTEKGKRNRLPSIATKRDALEGIETILQATLDSVGKALLTEAETAVTSAPATVEQTVTKAPAEETQTQTEITVPLSIDSDAERPKAVCARPKVPEQIVVAEVVLAVAENPIK